MKKEGKKRNHNQKTKNEQKSSSWLMMSPRAIKYNSKEHDAERLL